ncbi:MAG: HAD-IIB family hydrolase [Halioglobus sp.]
MKRQDAVGHLVFTDLDGSLLDHDSYSFAPALPRLQQLEAAHIPVIFCSSKTRAEILTLRDATSNTHPFIVENGAAVFIPEDYFSEQPAQTCSRDGFWVYEFSQSRSRWLQILEGMEEEFNGEFTCFHRAGVEGVARMTGLALPEAALASARDYSEPVQWLGSAESKAQFISRLQERGATVLAGGRFLGVGGDCDKGRALLWLRNVYQRNHPDSVLRDLAIGDSGNDVAMLEVGGSALLVRSPVHDFPKLEREADVFRSSKSGPDGWAEGVAEWLAP